MAKLKIPSVDATQQNVQVGTTGAAIIALVIVAFIFWLYVTQRLRPIIRTVVDGPTGTGPTGAPAAGGAATPASFAQNNTPVGLAGLQFPAQGIVAGDNPAGLGVGTVRTGTVQPASGITGRQAKDAVRDVGLGLLAATGPVGAGVAGVAKMLGFKL